MKFLAVTWFGLGIEFKAEDTTNLGRIDLTIATPDMSQVYIIEFKVVKNENRNGKALDMVIHELVYLLHYLLDFSDWEVGIGGYFDGDCSCVHE